MADDALERGLEALDRRQGWRGPLGRMSDDADIDATLDEYTKKLRPNHYAALVTKVTRRSAEIYVQGRNANIPFQLAFWAYPPRDEDGVRPPPLKDLRNALAVNDIVIVQPPGFTPDLIRNGFVPKSDDFALGQRPAVEGAIVAMDPHTGRLLAMTGAIIMPSPNLIGQRKLCVNRGLLLNHLFIWRHLMLALAHYADFRCAISC